MRTLCFVTTTLVALVVGFGPAAQDDAGATRPAVLKLFADVDVTFARETDGTCMVTVGDTGVDQ